MMDKTTKHNQNTRQLFLNNVLVGGGAPVTVQSMTTTRTHDVEATILQINQLAMAGCDVIRVACPTNKDALALSDIVKGSSIPVIADIHFQSKYVYQAIESGCAGVRVNPGNIKNLDVELPKIVMMATDYKTPLRIGVNAGSLDAEILQKYNGVTSADALVEAALKEANQFEKLGFYDFAISLKHHDPMIVVEAYEKLSTHGNWPLHLGVTEAGADLQGIVKSTTAFAILLAKGIGDTIRVSLSNDPIEEVKTGLEILYSLGLRERKLEIISCPTCGRKEADVIKLVQNVKRVFENDEILVNKKLKVAIMGCIVNGPGEAREADIGVAGGRDKGQIFIKGNVVKTVPSANIVEELYKAALAL